MRVLVEDAAGYPAIQLLLPDAPIQVGQGEHILHVIVTNLERT